jgi:hypothetical protein
MSVLERSILSLLYDRHLNKVQIYEELADKAIDKINKAIERLLTKKMISYLVVEGKYQNNFSYLD